MDTVNQPASFYGGTIQIWSFFTCVGGKEAGLGRCTFINRQGTNKGSHCCYSCAFLLFPWRSSPRASEARVLILRQEWRMHATGMQRTQQNCNLLLLFAPVSEEGILADVVFIVCGIKTLEKRLKPKQSYLLPLSPCSILYQLPSGFIWCSTWGFLWLLLLIWSQRCVPELSLLLCLGFFFFIF